MPVAVFGVRAPPKLQDYLRYGLQAVLTSMTNCVMRCKGLCAFQSCVLCNCTCMNWQRGLHACDVCCVFSSISQLCWCGYSQRQVLAGG